MNKLINYTNCYFKCDTRKLEYIRIGKYINKFSHEYMKSKTAIEHITISEKFVVK